MLNELPFTAEYGEYDTTSAQATHLLHLKVLETWVLGVFKNQYTSVMLQLYKSLVRCIAADNTRSKVTPATLNR